MNSESVSGPFVNGSSSPPFMRFPSNGRQQQEELINHYEAEEEWILNTLSKKLEQLRQDKIDLERIHEEESESHVNRLARELAALRMRQQQQTPQPNGGSRNEDAATAGPLHSHSANGSTSSNAYSGINQTAPSHVRFGGVYPDPNPSIILDALKKENETLRARLVDMECEHGQLKRINEVYREELIEHRARLGLPVDHLVGLSSGTERDPLSQPIHLRRLSTSTQQTGSMVSVPNGNGRPTPIVPIPRASQASQPRRTHEPGPSISSLTSDTPSTSSSPSPCMSPMNTGAPASYVTTLTSPPSSASLHASPPAPYDISHGTPAGRVLSYPSVPPPSLSSSLGSPVVATHMASEGDGRHGSASRRSSGSAFGHNWGYGGGTNVNGSERRVVETGNLRDVARSRTRSIERGGRIAESGTLVRSRAGSGSSLTGSGAADLGVFVPSLDETLE